MAIFFWKVGIEYVIRNWSSLPHSQIVIDIVGREDIFQHQQFAFDSNANTKIKNWNTHVDILYTFPQRLMELSRSMKIRWKKKIQFTLALKTQTCYNISSWRNVLIMCAPLRCTVLKCTFNQTQCIMKESTIFAVYYQNITISSILYCYFSGMHCAETRFRSIIRYEICESMRVRRSWCAWRRTEGGWAVVVLGTSLSS